MNTTVEGEKKRWITGVVIRGPHHMRSATDKSNLIIMTNERSLNFFIVNISLAKTVSKKWLVNHIEKSLIQSNPENQR